MPRPYVLIVDDEPAIAKSLSRFLEGRGFDTTIAGDTLTALGLITERRWDVVVLDLLLGDDQRGDELLEAASIVDPDLPGRTIFMTGDLSPRALELIRATGCRFYLRKPFSLTLLLDTVRALIVADRKPGADGRQASA